MKPSDMKTSASAAVVMTLFATFFWGSNFRAAKIALTSIPPWKASLERFSLAVIGTFAILLFREKIRWEVLSNNLVAFVVLGVVSVAGFNGALFVGLQTSSPITASLIMATTPISANFIEAIIHRQVPAADRIVGMIISLLGVSLVITNGQILSGHIDFARGDLLIFVGSLGWALYTVGARAFASNSTPFETTTWTMLFGTVALGIVAFLFESPIESLADGSGMSFLSILWMGIAGSILAILFWNVGVAVRGAGKTSIFFNFVPIFALIIELAMGTAPRFWQLVGIAITMVGVLIGQGRLAGLAAKEQVRR